MKKHKPLPKGKRVTLYCHGYPANSETAHVPVIWEDVWMKFRGYGRHDLRELGPCFVGMDDVQGEIQVSEFRIGQVNELLAAGPNPKTGRYKRFGRNETEAELREEIAEQEAEIVETNERLARLLAGEIVFDANDKHEKNIPIIYMPYEMLDRATLEEGIVYYMRRLGFNTPPRLKWDRSSFIVWSC